MAGGGRRNGDGRRRQHGPTAEDWRNAQWHPQVHQRWYRHELHFWFFGFAESYHSQELLVEVEATLEEHGVTSYVCYEVMGAYDLVVRAWVPHEAANPLADALYERLAPEAENSFTVSDHLRHWVWAADKRAKTGPIRPPDSEMLDQGPSPDVALVDQRSQAGAEGRLLRAYAKKDMIAPTRAGEGIKLMILVHGSRLQRELKAKRQMKRKIAEFLDRTGTLVEERSLYYGDYQQIVFLVMCRVPFKNFHRIREELLAEIAELLGLAGVRTTTLPVTSPGVLRFTDRLALPPVAETRRSIEEMLEAGEDERTEFKAAAFTPISDWLEHGHTLPAKPPRSFARESVLKAVAGLLNARGGAVVTGVVEASKSGAAEERLAEFPAQGEYVCIGIRDRVYTDKNWDAFKLKLEQMIKTNISPNPGNLIEIERGRFKGQTLCVVRVQDDPLTEAFFVKDEPDLCVRRGASTDRLRGREQHEHIKWRQDRARRFRNDLDNG